jgi:putative alpha-1,2-mannosidase
LATTPFGMVLLGRYRGMDQKIHQDPAYTNHTVFSLDTFRAQHPLYTIIDPERDQRWIRSLLRKHDEGDIMSGAELVFEMDNKKTVF